MTACRLNNIAVLNATYTKNERIVLVDDEIIQESVAGVGITEFTFGANS